MQSPLYLPHMPPTPISLLLHSRSNNIKLVHLRSQNLQMVNIILIPENIFRGFFVSNQWLIIPLQIIG